MITVPELAADAQSATRRLWQRLEEMDAHPFAPARLLATPMGAS